MAYASDGTRDGARDGAQALPMPRPARRGRRLRRAGRLAFVAAAAGLMLAPALVHLTGARLPDRLAALASTGENRRLADPPGVPQGFRDLLALPGQVDAYLNDHFGLRPTLIAANNRIRYALFGTLSSPQLTPGKDGHIYFNSHDAAQPLDMIERLCGQGVTPGWTAEAAGRIGAFLERATALNPQSTLVFVPTKPALYPEHLPDWLQAQCRRGPSPLPAVMEAVRADARADGRVLYPYDAMMAMKASLEVYPKENFHWTGEAPRRLAEQIAETRFGLAKRVELPSVEVPQPSDLQHFAPGVPLGITTRVLDYAAAGVTPCVGDAAACFPELGEIAGKLGDMTRYRAAQPDGPKLLLVSDSFGFGIAGAFSQYFGEVWHIGTNDIGRLTTEERKRLIDTAFGSFAPDRVLYLYHDFAVGFFTNYAQKIVEPAP